MLDIREAMKVSFRNDDRVDKDRIVTKSYGRKHINCR